MAGILSPASSIRGNPWWLLPDSKNLILFGNLASKTIKVSDQASRIPSIMLNGNLLQRSESLLSLSSIGSAGSLESATSTSSNMTATDVAICTRKWEEIAKLHKRIKCKIGRMKTTLTEMTASFEKQKNINTIVKYGVKHIKNRIEHHR